MCNDWMNAFMEKNAVKICEKVWNNLRQLRPKGPFYSPVYSPAPAGMPIRLGRSVRREQEAYVGL